MTPRRAAAAGAVTGSALGLIVGIRLARAWLVVHYSEKALRRFTRLLRNDAWRRDRYRMEVEGPVDLHDLQGPEPVTAPVWPAASRHTPPLDADPRAWARASDQ